MLNRWSADALDRELARHNPIAEGELGEAAHSPPATALLRRIFDLADDEISTRAELTAGGTVPGGDQVGAGGGQPRWSGRHVRRAAVALALLAAIAGTTSVVAATVDRPTLPHRATTKWLAARPLAAPAVSTLGSLRSSHPATSTTGWQVVSDLQPAGWRLGTPGPGPGTVTCPTAAVCYVTADNAAGSSGPSVLGALYVSTNGATSWSALALPAGLTFTSQLTCVSAAVCAAGGVDRGATVFAETTDGGHRWTVTTTGRTGTLLQLSCLSARHCAALSVATSDVAALRGGRRPPRPLDEHLALTSDGGGTWTQRSLPRTVEFSSVRCPAASSCVAVGFPAGARAKALGGVAVWTDDGGRRWWRASLPAGVGFSRHSDLACSGVATCMAIATTVVQSAARCVTGITSDSPSGAVPMARQCTAPAAVQVSTVVTTSDAGASWQRKPLPSSVPHLQLDTVACSTLLTCWVAGTQAASQGSAPGSAVLLGSYNGGAAWAPATVAAPANAPHGRDGDAHLSVGSISCPAVGVCVALGTVDQGASFAPVYRLGGAS